MPTPKPRAAHSKDATASVKSVVASLAESWNRHDMAAFAAAFCDDADFVNVIGMHWHGREEIETKARKRIGRSSAIVFCRSSKSRCGFLTPTIALTHARTELKGAESLRERVAPDATLTIDLRADEGSRPLVDHSGA